MADSAATAIERALSELPSWRPPMRVKRERLFWTARIDAYPFGAGRGLTRDAATRRAVARARRNPRTHDVARLPHEAPRRDDEKKRDESNLAQTVVSGHRTDDHPVADRMRNRRIFITHAEVHRVLAGLAGGRNLIFTERLNVAEGVGAHAGTTPPTVTESVRLG